MTTHDDHTVSSDGQPPIPHDLPPGAFGTITLEPATMPGKSWPGFSGLPLDVI